MNKLAEVPTDATESINENYIYSTINMLKLVKNNRSGYSINTISIDGLLTDRIEPSVIYKNLYNALSIINLKDLITNRDLNIRDINVIRLYSIILDIINDNKNIENKSIEFRELAITSDKYSYDFDSLQDPMTVPSMYIEDLKSKLILKDINYIMSTHIDKLISSLGYINLCLFVNINRFNIPD